MSDNCRHCGKTMRWAFNESTDKRIPLDPEPTSNGPMVMAAFNVGGDLIVRFLNKGESAGIAPRYTAHARTCTTKPLVLSATRESEHCGG